MESGATELCRGANYRLDSPLVSELDMTGGDNVVKYWTNMFGGSSSIELHLLVWEPKLRLA